MNDKSRKCIICGNNGDKIFSEKVLGKYDVNYFRCPCCEAIYTQKVTWSEEAYQDALNNMDTGVMQRNLDLANRVADLLYCFFPDNKITGMDFAGGYGIMTRLLRDKGFDFRWYDKFAENLVAKGYEFQNGTVDVVTAFEVFEHFTDPIADLTWIAKFQPKLFIFSTLTYCEGGGTKQGLVVLWF